MRRRGKQLGFTLIELMIVISIMLILLSIAIPNYNRAIISSKEAVLADNLFTMRSGIDQFTFDKHRAPQSLEDLVTAGYLRQIPKDPITNSADTWQVVQEDVMSSVDQQQPGITDVKSGAEGNSADGRPYSEF